MKSPIHGTARQTATGIEVLLHVPTPDSVATRVATDAPTRFRVPDVLPPEPEPGKAKRTHSIDFTSVLWDGVVYLFTPKQRAVVSSLWQAMEDGHHYLSTAILLEEAESEGKAVSGLFDRHPAWGTMIVRGTTAGGPTGTYRLAP